ncbi:MAG: PAS domain S-box protein [Lachnospiraceae bacterium]|nr:PAS domain S-box protein [Lachnospiraceae bacterium]
MNNMLNNMEDILGRQICGFHQYILDEPVRLCYASHNLCEMIGVREEDLLQENKDMYIFYVHEADREKYSEFLNKLARKEQTLTAEYRLMKRDGSVLYVKDTATSQRTEEGILMASSVLDDITKLKQESARFQSLHGMIPCGFLRYTCERQPQITFMNQTMNEILRFPEVGEGELDYHELYKSNIFMMIPMEERRRFSKYLNRVYTADAPIAGEISLLRCDGTRAHVFGWVMKCINEEGTAEFQSVCVDVTKRHQARKADETKRYLKALTDIYDKIFEFNLDGNTVKCLHSEDSSVFKHLEEVAMQMEEASEKWIMDSVDRKDRERVRSFFQIFFQKKLYGADAKPPQITYRARSSEGKQKKYNGIFIKVDETVSFYCCRSILDSEEARILRNENHQLKENMKELVMRFTDGLAAFEISAEGLVKPLYASENVCEFFGYTREEWLPLMENATPFDNFIAYSKTAYEDFVQLLRNGEAEFTYYDHKTNAQRRIKAICSQKEPNGNSARYVMLYSMEGMETEEKRTLPERRVVSIRTFGYFDVFVGERPIAFRNKKSKELFALLVDRKGGFVTSEEAISFLWEEEPANTVTLARYRKVALRLKNTLEEYGISDVIETVDGKRRIVPEKIKCDLYDYLSGKEAYAQLFKGNYLTNYSWGETTLGELLNN